MRFTLPKPLHGWREFLGEVGIIVIGVLIALAAQQVVETIDKRGQAASAEQRIKHEMARNAALALERIALRECLAQRIGMLAHELAAGRTDWSGIAYPPRPGRALGAMYHKPSRKWETDAYREALSTGSLDSLPADRRAWFGLLYSSVDSLTSANDDEQDLAEALAPLQFNPALTQGERNQMIATLARLDRLNGLIVIVARQMLSNEHRANLAEPTDQMFAHADGTWGEELAMLRQKYGNCVDAGAPREYEAIALRGDKAR